jgi:hypothetical protein
MKTTGAKQGSWIKRNPTASKIILYSVIAIILFFVTAKIIKAIRKSQAEKQMGKNDAVSQAQALRIAFNPSGIGWLSNVDTTEETTLWKIAEKIVDIEEVAKQYNKLYGTSLYDDLQSELDGAEYEKFMRIVRKEVGESGTPLMTGAFVETGKYVITTGDVVVRKTAEKDDGFLGTGAGHNRLYYPSIPAGVLIGVTTGNQVMDYENDVLFLEVKVLRTDGTKTKAYAWRGHVDIGTIAELKQKYGDSIKAFKFP